MRARQWRDGSKSAVLLAQSSIGPNSSARSGQDSTHMGCSPRRRANNNHRTSSCALFQLVLWRAVRTSHVAVAAADTNSSSTTTKPSSRLCIAPLGQTLYMRGHRNGYRRWRDNKRTLLVPDAIIFLPVAASVFINTRKLTSGPRSLKSLHASSQVFSQYSGWNR